MAVINSILRKPSCSNGIFVKLSRLKYIPSIFRNYKINVIIGEKTEIFQSIYNVQYTYHSTYTHCILDYKPFRHVISDGISHKLNCRNRNYSNVSKLGKLESEESGRTCSPKTIEIQKNGVEISYEDYWSEEQIEEIRNQRPELLVRGKVFVPAFSTSESKLVPSDSSNPETQDPEREEVREKRPRSKDLKIYGFISRNRAFHGDEVLAIKSRRHKLPPPITEWKETPEECRVIKVFNRSEELSNFLATFNLNEFFDDSLNYVRCQPKDTRWPGFRVPKSEIGEEIFKELRSVSQDQKILCMCKLEEWEKNDIEPTGSIKSLIGKAGEARSQMEATMIFHGLNPIGFSEKVLNDLNNLIKEGDENKNINRENMNHLYVLSIDPQDAKDLDDALSIEKINDDKGKVYYKIGIHIADVSHYVKEDSLVDLDARNRATSVYLEHLVYPMLPRELSENLCSLLPNKERLCFSVFVEVAESGEGEKIGNDLYLQKVDFKLTTITSKNRLGYYNAKTILYNTLNRKKGTKEMDLGSMTFEDFEKLVNQLEVEDETKLSLLRLYYLSQKLRFYRLNQLGAVHVDIDGSIKCHIPEVKGEVEKEELDKYMNNKGKLDKNYHLKIEKIPKESHELIEEMMLLANTQVAKFLSKKIDLYLLRVHEDTSKAVKAFILEVLPQNLKNLIKADELEVTQVLSKCEEYMDPVAFQSLSFSALQKFKEAIYSPINKMSEYENYEQANMNYQGHWGLALPVYLHFTSPIRRYPDLYTHRMLKNILYSKVENKSYDLLSEICERCNIQKRRAFDAQKEYKNYAFNKYLQFVSSISPSLDPKYLKTMSISRAFVNKEEKGEDEEKKYKNVWGYLYGDAVISSIVVTNEGKSSGGEKKSESLGRVSVVFYIPLLNEMKSISCESLNLVPINVRFEKNKKKKKVVKSSILNSYYGNNEKELKTRREMKEETIGVEETKVQGVSVMMKDKRMELYIYQKMKVLLVPGSKMWTVRIPVDYLK